jgi:endonuclease/exonuclease/phosphatase (EEP) superfamily protein YafD
MIGPIMGMCLPWRAALASSTSGQPLRIITCNGHDQELDVKAFADFAAQAKPDIICLQVVDHKVVTALFGDGPWHIAGDGEHSLVSRFPIRKDNSLALSHVPFLDRFDVETPNGVITILNVHLSSPHVAFKSTLAGEPNASYKIDANNERRESELELLHVYMQEIHQPVILAGDFNTPIESPDFRYNLGSLSNAFSVAGFGFGWTYHYGGTNARIDHILYTDDWQCRSCWVGPQVGSPHRPLIADLEARKR